MHHFPLTYSMREAAAGLAAFGHGGAAVFFGHSPATTILIINNYKLNILCV